MPTNEPTRAEHRDFRDAAEARVLDAVETAMTSWLGRVDRTIREAIRQDVPVDSLVAASADIPLSLGQMANWWAQAVDDFVTDILIKVWRDTYLNTRGGEILETSLDRLEVFVAAVRDRLVRGLEPPLPDDAMNRVRFVITAGAGLGWSTRRVSDTIGQSLQWEQDGSDLRREIAGYTADIEALLDPLGPPGSPAREHARENDPRVDWLQRLRASAVTEADDERSHWEVRATRIARTESTAAYNFANLAALADEGWTHKEWMSTHDSRTRPHHVEANGQVVSIAQPFEVGTSLLMMPGDPSGPAFEVINCRCIALGSDGPATA